MSAGGKWRGTSFYPGPGGRNKCSRPFSQEIKHSTFTSDIGKLKGPPAVSHKTNPTPSTLCWPTGDKACCPSCRSVTECVCVCVPWLHCRAVFVYNSSRTDCKPVQANWPKLSKGELIMRRRRVRDGGDSRPQAARHLGAWMPGWLDGKMIKGCTDNRLSAINRTQMHRLCLSGRCEGGWY